MARINQIVSGNAHYTVAYIVFLQEENCASASDECVNHINQA